MVNWTPHSLSKENSWKNDGKFDLPVPMTLHDCSGYIDEVDELLGLFESSDLHDENEMLLADAKNLLYGLEPNDIEEYDLDWQDSLKMWLFKDEIIQVCNGHTEEHRTFLIGVCLEYLNQLYDRYEELGGDIEDLDR